MAFGKLRAIFDKAVTALGWDMDETALKLDTDGRTASRYHEAVHTPEDFPFKHRAFIIGIEKTDPERIGASTGIDSSRFKYRENMNTDERDFFEDLLENRDEKMFVSHTFSYSGKDGETAPDFLYNVYDQSKSASPDNAYENGWRALDDLDRSIRSALHEGLRQGKPYTHIIVGSMGWNNDQKQALSHYDKILNNIKDEKGVIESEVNPLFIGLTWPSVWGRPSPLGLAEKFQHIVSYPTKAKDSDEIGITYGNYIVNNLVSGITSDFSKEKGYPADMKSVLIGHSMGVRLLSSAAYSRDMLKDEKGEPTDLLVGLQGAFSINRFIEGEGVEGAPYRNYADGAKNTIMTFSEHDDAVPIARWVTGALHVGSTEANTSIGCAIDEQVCPLSKRVFREMEWSALLSNTSLTHSKKILHVDASNLMPEGHSDIDNKYIGRFLSDTINKFAAPEPAIARPQIVQPVEWRYSGIYAPPSTEPTNPARQKAKSTPEFQPKADLSLS